MANLVAVALTFFVSIEVVRGRDDLTCFVTPPARDLKSVKKVELLAVRGSTDRPPSSRDVTMTFSGRDDGEIYSNGGIVEFGQMDSPPVLSTEGYDLQIQYARLSKPDDECLEPARFGVHYCDLFNGLDYTMLRAPLLIHNQKTLIPKDAIRTHVFSVGETLKLCVDSPLPKTWKGPIEWAFNGEQPIWLRRFSGSTCIEIKHVQTCQAGVYEAYRRICGRKERQHAYFDVVVRGCPDGFHTPPACTDSCVADCGIGYCGDDGMCVCPNGFTGADCSGVMQGRFTSLLHGELSAVGLDPDGKGSLVCTEHARCSCLPGWRGIECEEACDELTFGPDCAYSCPGGTECDSFTGGPPGITG